MRSLLTLLLSTALCALPVLALSEDTTPDGASDPERERLERRLAEELRRRGGSEEGLGWLGGAGEDEVRRRLGERAAEIWQSGGADALRIWFLGNRYADARERARVARECADAARRRAEGLSAEAQDRLVRADRHFATLSAEAADLRRQIGEKTLELARAQALAASANDEYANARRRYDAVRPLYEIIGQSGSLADYPEWRRIESLVVSLGRRAEEARREATPKIAALEREREALEGRLRPVLARIDEFATVPVHEPRARAAAALDLHEAEAAARDAETEAAARFDLYAAALRLRVPVLQEVRVSSDGRQIYRAHWRPEGKDGETPLQERRQRLLRALDRLELTTLEQEEFRREEAAERLAMMAALQKWGPELEAQAKRMGDAEWNKEASAAVIEGATVILEVLLTGGAASAARVARDAYGKMAARIGGGRAARTALRAAEADAAAVARRYVDDTLKQTAARVESRWAEVVRETAREAGEVAGKASPDMLAKGRLLRQQVAKRIADQDVRLAELGRLHAQFAEQAARAERVADLGATFASKATSAVVMHERLLGFESRVATWYVPLIANPDARKIFVGDLIEFGVEKAGRHALDAGLAAADEYVSRAGRWQSALKSGAGVFLRPGFSLEALHGAVRDQGNLISLVSTAAKLAAVTWFAQEQQAAATLYADILAHVDQRYGLYVASREADRRVLEMLRENYRNRAEIRGYLLTFADSRRLVTSDASADAPPGPTLDIALEFSKPLPLRAPPRVTLAGIPVTMEAVDAGEDGVVTWRGKADTPDVPEGEALLEVSSAPDARPLDHLDSDPATPARIDLSVPLPAGQPADAYQWLDWERGTDRQHRIPLRDLFEGLWRRGETVLRLDREGRRVTGRVVSPSRRSREDLGFEEGMEVLVGEVNGRTLQAMVLVHYGRDLRGACGAAPYWSEIRYEMSAPGRLKGSWENRVIGEDCQARAVENEADELVRESSGR